MSIYEFVTDADPIRIRCDSMTVAIIRYKQHYDGIKYHEIREYRDRVHVGGIRLMDNKWLVYGKG